MEETTPAWLLSRNNPHILQTKKEIGDQLPFVRTLQSDSCREHYVGGNKRDNTVIHWGQRKLLLSEIELLTNYGSAANPVVYAGAASGTHLTKLATMFPNHEFHCYDPAPFNVKPLPNLHTYQVLFTDELALAMLGKDVIFISDIRAMDPLHGSASETTECIESDMNDQQRWVALMQPIVTLLKFSLPWKPGKTSYLNGIIYLPIFTSSTSTESRLLVVCNPLKAIPSHSDTPGSSSSATSLVTIEPPDDGKIVLRNTSGFLLQMRDYDHIVYEEQMHYFNKRQRVALYPHNINVPGLDHCYDCSAEVHILENYCVQVTKITDPVILQQCVACLSVEISDCLSYSRNLMSGNLDNTKRKHEIQKRQWQDGRPAYQAATEQRNFQIETNTLPSLLLTTQKPALDCIRRSRIENVVPASSGTTDIALCTSHLDQVRRVFERKPTTFPLAQLPPLERQQQPASNTGWARCETKTGEIVFSNALKNIYSTEPPIVSGFILRAGKVSNTETCWWESVISKEVFIDVPDELGREQFIALKKSYA
jgi:hypothetical protein